MTTRTSYFVSLVLLAGLVNPLLAQVPGAGTPAAVAAPVGTTTAGTGGQTIWKFFGLSKENIAGCKDKFCQSQLGMMANNFMKPVNTFAGGLFPSCCPPVRAADLAKPADSAEGAAARIKQDELAAKARREAVRYLGTVDCRYWPEAQDGLINALRADRNECVRWEAALALGRGCCCNKATIKALTLTVTGSQEDGNPAECSERVKAAAAGALQHCLACLTVEPQQPELLPEKPREGEKPRELPPNGGPAPTGVLPTPAGSRTNGTIGSPKAVGSGQWAVGRDQSGIKGQESGNTTPHHSPLTTHHSPVLIRELTLPARHSSVTPAVTPVSYYKRVENVSIAKLAEQAKAGLSTPTTPGMQPSKAEGGLVGIIMGAMDGPGSSGQQSVGSGQWTGSFRAGAPATEAMRNAEGGSKHGQTPLTTHHSPLTTHHSPLTTTHQWADAPRSPLGSSNLKPSLPSPQPTIFNLEPLPMTRLGFAWHSFKNRLVGNEPTSGGVVVTQGMTIPGEPGFIDGPQLIVDGPLLVQPASAPTLQQSSQGALARAENHLKNVVHHPASAYPRTLPPSQQAVFPSPTSPQRSTGTVGGDGPILVQRSGDMAIDFKQGQLAHPPAAPQTAAKPAEITPASTNSSASWTPSIRSMVSRDVDTKLPVAGGGVAPAGTDTAKANRSTSHVVLSVNGPELFPGASGTTMQSSAPAAPSPRAGRGSPDPALLSAWSETIAERELPVAAGAPVPATEVARLTTLLTISVDPRARETAAKGLAVVDWKANGQAVSALLARAHHDPDPRVRVACISSLAEMKANSPAVMNGLQQLQFDRNLDVVREARKAMNRLRTGSTTSATLLFSR